MSTLNNPGRFSPLLKLHPDEPIFVLRAQDSEAADLVELWAIRSGAAGCNSDKVHEAKQLAEEMRRWPKRKVAD